MICKQKIGYFLSQKNSNIKTKIPVVSFSVVLIDSEQVILN